MTENSLKHLLLCMRNIIIAGLLAMPVVSSAGGNEVDVDCWKASVMGNIIFTGSVLPGETPIGFGVSTYQHRGGEKMADVTVNLLAPPVVGADGSMLLKTRLQHDFNSEDSLIWQTQTLLQPAGWPGEFVLSETISLVGGEGTVSFNSGQGLIDGYALVCSEDNNGDHVSDDDSKD